MFKEIIYIDYDAEYDYKYRYSLVDTEFEATITVMTTSYVPIKIQEEYQKRNLPTEVNILRYYRWMMKINKCSFADIVEDVSKGGANEQAFFQKHLKFLCRNLVP